MQNANSIVTFQADWHHELGAKLAGFPRSVPLLGQIFWPDLASLLEDYESRQMMYYTPAPSVWSVQVAFREQQRSWNLAAFNDASLTAQSAGSSLVSVTQELAARLK